MSFFLITETEGDNSWKELMAVSSTCYVLPIIMYINKGRADFNSCWYKKGKTILLRGLTLKKLASSLKTI